MKHGTYSIGKRLMALLLSIVMVVACVPAMAIGANAANGSTAQVSSTVDPHTLDQWKNYFGVMAANNNNVLLTTEYAGGVWTDKSVFDPGALPSQLTGAKYNGNSFAVTDRGNNFIVSLSAIASNKQIKGYSTLPTDTVFVLDLSSSMRSADSNGRSAVDELIAATNQAITDLLELNKNNRVAVIVYAGNVNRSFSNAQGITTIILPLDTYTTDKTENGVGVYLQADPLTVRQNRQDVPNTNPTALAVYDGVSSTTGKSNAFRQNGFESETGTFMQDGVYEAMKVLLAADTAVEGGVQAGTERLPIMVVMTDGEPTLASTDYNGNNARTDLGTSNMSSYSGSTGGISHRDTIAFVTALTMAFAKKELASHYKETPLLYTLAYGNSVQNRDEAMSTLNPAQSSSTQNSLWNRFLAGETIPVFSGNQTVRNSTVTSERLTAADRLYVDRFFTANNNSGDTNAMQQAFQAIVNEIILQSKYYPTYVQSDTNHDGYLTFVDKIGEYMEVSSIKGIIIGNRLFSGAVLVQNFNSGALGTIENPTELGHAYVRSVKERLGIEDTSVAQALLNSAYTKGQIYYNSDTDFDHYIGWYAKPDGTFVDAWYEGSQVPAGATHIIKSYAFLGDTTDVPGVANTDMLYMTVRVATEIATGESIVTWKIPASLVPTLTYEVDVEVDDDGNIVRLMDLATEAQTAESPIRLVYEVALREDIYDWNLTEKVDVNYTPYKDPGYVFYTNKWHTDPEDTTRNTYSHFEPSVANERYYFTQDTQILSDAQGTVYQGNAKPTGTGYYRSYNCYEKLTDGSLRTHSHYEAITAEALETAVSDGAGGWVIPKGTVHRYYDFEITDKTNNVTGTMGHSDHPFVEKNGDVYYTYSTQGNNGKLSMTPATGIKLTKTLAEGFASDETFTFVITGDLTNAQVVRLTDTGAESARTAIAQNGEVTLKAGETVYIVGLTASDYTVTEKIASGAAYKVSAVKVNGQTVNGKQADITLAAQTIVPVEFTNDARGYGNLIVSKDVVHPFPVAPNALTAKQFAITVDLDGEDVANKTFSATGLPGVTSVTTDADGKFTVQLRHDEALTVLSIPENTTYTVTEALTAADAGYRMDPQYSVLTGIIDKAQPAQAYVVNVYEPAPAAQSLTVTGTKTVTSEGVPFDWTNKSFQFKLESFDPETGAYTPIGNILEVTANGGSYAFSNLTFDTLGTYYYKVSEVIPDRQDRMAHMSYDTSTGRIVIHVTDNDADGQLELDVRDYTTGNSLPASNNVITFRKDFANTYTETYPPSEAEFDVIKQVVDPHNTGVTPAGFLFGLYRPGETQPAYTLRTVGTDGRIRFRIPVTEPGTQTFILREIIPADADQIPGMVYDTSEYTVTITSTYSPSGWLHSTTGTKNGQTAGAFTFENRMELNAAHAQFAVNKVVEGNPLFTDHYAFTLLETDSSFVTMKPDGVLDSVMISGSGTDVFDSIEYTAVGTHYYVVREIPGTRGGMTYDAATYHITVNVTANGRDLVATTTINKLGEGTVGEIRFVNTYRISGNASVTIDGVKTLQGRPMLNGEFTFRLEQVDAQGAPVANGYTATAANGPANGANQAAFRFAPISYTEPGTYYYKISEQAGAPNNGVTYDGGSYIVVVTVSDDQNGGLAATWEIENASQLSFYNRYKPAAINAEILGGKDLTGRVLRDGEFEFELYTTDSAFNTTGLTATETKKNDLHGDINFSTLHYTEEGTHYYVVKEKNTQAGGVTYDEGEYHVTISVVDNHKGQLETFTVIERQEANGDKFVASSIVFYNEYATGNAEVTFTVEKTMEGLRTDPAGFRFDLYEDLNGAPIQTVISDADGVVSFEKITYTQADLEKGGYTYYIRERIPAGNHNGITYDQTIYTVEVTLTDDGNGNILVSYTVNDADVDENTYRFAFRNRYDVTEGTTFDITGKKILEGKPLTANMFTFELYAGDTPTGTPIATVKNAADGTVLFEDVSLNTLGRHTFTVKEQTPAGGKLDGITYSTRIYTVTVVTTDNGVGGMTAGTPVYALGSVQQNAMEFTNSYAVTEGTTFDITGQKILEGKPLTANMFTFELYAGDTPTGTPIATVKNAADGTILFEDVALNQLGDNTFTVKEQTPAGGKLDGITYSELVYTVTVTTTDNGVGGMTAGTPVYKLGGTQQQAMTFTNTYAVEGQANVSVDAAKVLNGGKKLTDNLFTFVLSREGEPDKLAQNKADGSVAFQLTFTAPGTYTYTLKEQVPANANDGITYDATVYTVTIQVNDNGMGGLTAEAPVYQKGNDPVRIPTFTNTYNPSDVGVSLDIQKTVKVNSGEGVGPEGFQFKVTDKSGKELATVTSGTDGKAAHKLTFTAADIGNTYTYYVTEVDTNVTGVTYSTVKHTVEITLTQNDQGQIVPQIKVNGTDAAKAELAFVNTFDKAETPVTGDDFNIVFYVVVMAAAFVGVVTTVVIKKKKEEYAE